MNRYGSWPAPPTRASLETCQCLHSQCPITGGQRWKSILIQEADEPKCYGIYHFCLHDLCVKEFLIFCNSNIFAWFLSRDIKSSRTSSTFEAGGFLPPSHQTPAQRPSGVRPRPTDAAGFPFPAPGPLVLRPSLTPVHPSRRCSGHALFVPAWWLAAKTPAWIESGSWAHIDSRLPRWLWAPHPYSVCTGQRVRVHRERVKKGFNKQIGQTAVIRHPAQSYKHTDQQCFTCNWPLLYTSLPRPSLFCTSPLP